MFQVTRTSLPLCFFGATLNKEINIVSSKIEYTKEYKNVHSDIQTMLKTHLLYPRHHASSWENNDGETQTQALASRSYLNNKRITHKNYHGSKNFI